MQQELFDKAKTEVRDLHRFFVSWYNKGSANTASFDRFEKAMAPGFQIIPPHGGILDRPTIIDTVRANRAKHDDDFAIEIEDIRRLWSATDEIMICYVEAQFSTGRWNRRRASALLTRDSLAPGGLAWLCLQETRMEAA